MSSPPTTTTKSSARRGPRAPMTNRLSALGSPRRLTLLAVIDGAIAGFASLKGAEEIDMLFVDPEFARQGAAGALIEALTKLAQARGAKRLTVDASDSARPLFERQGFTAERRNLVRVGDQWLANTTMAKTLTGERTPPTRH